MSVSVSESRRRSSRSISQRPCIAEGRAEGLARGVCRLLDEMGICPLVEVPLGTGRRADVVGLDGKGRFVIVEIKSGLADFRADTKWRDYRNHCDRLYFAVGSEFPSTCCRRTSA